MRVGLSLLLAGCVAAAAKADSRDDVLAAWGRSRTRLETIRYTMAGSIESREGASQATRSATPVSSTPPAYSGIVLLDFARRRHRLEETVPEISQADKSKYTTRTRLWVCDGSVAKSFHPRDKNQWYDGRPDLHVSRGDLRTQDFPAHYFPLFAAHGFVHSSQDMPSPGRWPELSDPDEFSAHGTVVLGGRTHTILRGEPYHGMQEEYWSDLGRGGTVGRVTTWVDKTDPYMRFDMEYQEVGGVWVLRRWTHTVSKRNRVLQVQRYEVTRVEINPPVTSSEFDIAVEPGFVVVEHNYPAKGSGLDPAFPARKTTRVRPDGGRDVVEESGFQTPEGFPVAVHRPWWTDWKFWLPGGAVLVIALAWMARRRARRSADGGPMAEGG